MERFLKRGAVEQEAPNRDADTHAKVPPAKGDGLLRYMSTSSVASLEEASVVKGDIARKKKPRKQASAMNTHTKVPPGKGDGLLRYMSTSSVASIEEASVVRGDDAKKKERRKQAAALIALTGCSQAVAAKHLSIKYVNVIGLCSERGRVINFSEHKISQWITKMGLP